MVEQCYTKIKQTSTSSKMIVFKEEQYNFTESGHGKISADCVVAQFKATADQIVAHVSNITNTHTVHKVRQLQMQKVLENLLIIRTIVTFGWWILQNVADARIQKM